MKYLRKLKIKLVPGEYQNMVKGQVREPKQLYRIFKAIKDKNQETLIGVYFDDDLEVRAYDVLSLGSEQTSGVYPDEIFERAILLKSRIFVLIRNHPSGNPTPSDADRELLTLILKQAEIMRRTLLDFIIVGDRRYWSMFEKAEGGDYALGAVGQSS